MHLFLRAHGLATAYPMLAKAKFGPYPTWYHKGPYCHEHSLRFNMEFYDFDDAMDGVYDVAMLREMGVTVWEDQYNAEIDGLKAAIKGAVRGHCQKLYWALEKEYDYLTSNEAVAEALHSNDILEEDSHESV